MVSSPSVSRLSPDEILFDGRTRTLSAYTKVSQCTTWRWVRELAETHRESDSFFPCYFEPFADPPFSDPSYAAVRYLSCIIRTQYNPCTFMFLLWSTMSWQFQCLHEVMLYTLCYARAPQRPNPMKKAPSPSKKLI